VTTQFVALTPKNPIAFKDKNVKAIVAIRGGWGCNRLLGEGVGGAGALLDFDVIRANPKPLVGYSDLTGLLTSIQQITGMITFHGPMGIDNWSNENVKNRKGFCECFKSFFNPHPQHLQQHSLYGLNKF
jgi:muramoyltetrapeptide carboxypeptidase LdcA involved in peptidoglycan recycling